MHVDRHAVAVDVSDPASAQAMADATIDEFGGIDHLVNNAAIFGGSRSRFPDVDWTVWADAFAVNTIGALRVRTAGLRDWRACMPGVLPVLPGIRRHDGGAMAERQ